jgi:DnaJ-class molecular chaperone
MAHKDYYQILGLSHDASTDALKKAYRKLAMQYHPDHNHGREEWANDKFKEINEAFSVLGDPQKRREYDHFGTAGDIGDVLGSQATRTTFEDLMNDFNSVGLEIDFLDNIFGDIFRGTGYIFHKFKRGFRGARGTSFEAQGDIDLENPFKQA